jgi:hypothetical protein
LTLGVIWQAGTSSPAVALGAKAGSRNVCSRAALGGRPSTRPGLDLAIAKGWLKLHESGTFGSLTQAGAALFA